MAFPRRTCRAAVQAWNSVALGRRIPMQKYIVQRLLLMIPTIVALTLLIFVGLRVFLPADVVDIMLGEYGRGNPELRAKLEDEVGLSGSIPEQYVEWLGLSWF